MSIYILLLILFTTQLSSKFPLLSLADFLDSFTMTVSLLRDSRCQFKSFPCRCYCCCHSTCEHLSTSTLVLLLSVFHMHCGWICSASSPRGYLDHRNCTSTSLRIHFLSKATHCQDVLSTVIFFLHRRCRPTSRCQHVSNHDPLALTAFTTVSCHHPLWSCPVQSLWSSQARTLTVMGVMEMLTPYFVTLLPPRYCLFHRASAPSCHRTSPCSCRRS